MSSSSSVPNDNDDDQLQPALKKVKANNCPCFSCNGSRGQMINAHSLAISPTVLPATTHIQRPSVLPGSALHQQISWQLPQNQPQPLLQQWHPPLLNHGVSMEQAAAIAVYFWQCLNNFPYYNFPYYPRLREALPSMVDQDAIHGNRHQDISTSDALEKRVLEDVILHDKIGINFDDIGALGDIKDQLKEVVILPFKRPGLFRKGQLRKLCRGVLLYGPSGTGKSMLAKAVAAEAGANLFNISFSNIASKWNADPHNFVKTLSSLATKMAPSILFIDEADSLFRKRSPGHYMMGKIKNDFMVYWDVLHSNDAEKIIVLAATNKPFDLDDTFIKRVPRRLMVNLPDVRSRSEILKVILEKEDLMEDVDFNAIAQMTNGFSGNDLKNLCIAAANRPIREIILKDKLKSRVVAEEEAAEIRPLNMEDFKDVFKQANGSKSMADNLRLNDGSNSGEKPPASMFI